jgi:hypothetical protein
MAYRLIGTRIFIYHRFLQPCQYYGKMKNFIINGAKKGLGDFPVNPHFIPNYNPWEQRFV